MPFPRPTLTTLRTQAMQDVTASDLPNANGFLTRSALRVLAWVQAGMAYLHYGYMDWIGLMSVPFTAVGEFLESWAAFAPTPVIRKAPTAATAIGVTFSATVGSALPSGVLMSGPNNQQYSTTVSATSVAPGVVTTAIVAVLPGSAGNAAVGTPLTLASAVEGVTSASGLATQGITGGTDLELDPSLKARMIESYTNPPLGGSAADYVTWALQVPGVTRAWCSPNQMGAGTVVVYFMLDEAESAFAGFPQGTNGVAAAETRTPQVAAGDQLAVANYIFPLRPVTALVYAAAPQALQIGFNFVNLSPNTTPIQNAINQSLANMFLMKGTAVGGTIYESDWEAAIEATPGVLEFEIAAPTLQVLTGVGQLPTLGPVTYP